MCRRISFVIMASILFLCSGWNAFAEPPQLISYQGFLADSEGPVSGSRSIVFSIYGLAEGGVPMWTSGTISIEVDGGYFYYMLGSDSTIPPACFDGPDRWLGVQILPDDEMTPRMRLTAVPYAYQTLRADTASVGGGWTIDEGEKDTKNIYPNDPNSLVGIGTSSPNSMLDIGNPSLPGVDLLTVDDSSFVIPDEGPILFGRELRIQDGDLGYDISVEAERAILGLVSTDASQDFGSEVRLAQYVSGGVTDYWSIIREKSTSTEGSGAGGLRFNYGYYGSENTVLRIDKKGNLTVNDESGDVIVEIGKGLDYSEMFITSGDKAVPGMVMVIDPNHPGCLALCGGAYDNKVAGVVAGANGLGTGVMLGSDAAGENNQAIALAGRVYCNVDTRYGEIAPGDLLTTSPTPGHAMVVKDASKAQGAILGKAMEGLRGVRKGQILTLVTLQ